MGLSEQAQVEGGFDSGNNRNWVMAGIALRAPLKPIYTAPVEKEEVDAEEHSTTPTALDSKIPTPLCPPPPRKPKSSFRFNYGLLPEFFTPPDLEAVFIGHVIDPTQEKNMNA